MKEPGSSFGKLVLESGCWEFMKSCSNGPRTKMVQRSSVNIRPPPPLALTPTVTFNFSYHFVLKLVTKVPISCLLEVLTSRQFLLTGPQSAQSVGPEGCAWCFGPWALTQCGWASAFFHIKHFCLKSLSRASFVSSIVTMINKTIKTIILGLFASTHQPFIFCAWLPGPFAGLWSF